jgi:CubicO group peptidase (beta-lactamase class C family)
MSIQHDILTIIDRYEAEEDFSGVVLVRQGDEDVVHEARGLAHQGFGVPNTIDTRFDIASVTKIFTAAAIMQLVDRGKIALDTRVMPFLGIAGTQISDDVTVFHCLTHTSGIGDDADEEAGEDYADLWIDTPNYSVRETRDFLPQFVDKEPNFAPGEGVRYNNVAFVLLGLVIERVSGLPYRDYVRQRIFAPAGMAGADFCAMDEVSANLAEGYTKIEREDGTVGWRKNIYSYPPVGSPDGGATVTARDLDRFVVAIRSGALMGADAARELLRPHVKRQDFRDGGLWNGFAFEFTVDSAGEVVRFGKDGVNAGVASFATWFPRDGITCVLLANQDCDVWAMQRELNPLFSDWYREG